MVEGWWPTASSVRWRGVRLAARPVQGHGAVRRCVPAAVWRSCCRVVTLAYLLRFSGRRRVVTVLDPCGIPVG